MMPVSVPGSYRYIQSDIAYIIQSIFYKLKCLFRLLFMDSHRLEIDATIKCPVPDRCNTVWYINEF